MRQVLGRIGCHSSGFTYVVPIGYAYDGESIFCHCSEGLKTDMMRKNPKVCFEVDALHGLAEWESVIAWGDYEEIRDPKQREKALLLLFERKLPTTVSDVFKLCDVWPFHLGNLNDISGIVFKIKLTNKTGRFERVVG
jgi:nitroimidazol reductase NimA-like FMN-containing flavoprotein (pyridoxamine 5'-phosphate oxidase superfamily)